MQEIHIILNWASVHKSDLLGIVGGSAGLSVFMEGLLLKLKNKWHVDSHAFALTLLHLLGVATAGASYFLSNSLTGKATVGVYASIVIVAEFWQRFAVSPFYKKYLIPFLTYQSANKPTVVKTDVASTDAQSTELA